MENLELPKPILNKDQYINIRKLQVLRIKSKINTITLLILNCNVYKINIHHNQILFSKLLLLFYNTIYQKLSTLLLLILSILIIYLISCVQLSTLKLDQQLSNLI